MPDFQNGKIYAIRSHQTDQVYIGSTTQTLTQRFAVHKSHYIKNCSTCTSSILFQYDDVYIDLIELFPCSTRVEMDRREGEIIKSTPNCVNRHIAGRTRQEYRSDNPMVMKLWYERNPDKKKQYNKKTYERHKETINYKHRLRYAQNRDAINARRREKRQAAKLNQQSVEGVACTF